MSKPTHKLYQVIQNGDAKAFWQQLGAAWESETNPGTFQVRLNAIPLSGELVIRPAKSDDTDQE